MEFDKCDNDKKKNRKKSCALFIEDVTVEMELNKLLPN